MYLKTNTAYAPSEQLREVRQPSCLGGSDFGGKGTLIEEGEAQRGTAVARGKGRNPTSHLRV